MCENNISDPMSFLYLDMMANILIEDTKELEREFETKINFIKEQELSCLENGRQLIIVDQLVDALKSCLYQTELELQENETTLLEAEKAISQYELLASKHFTCPNDVAWPLKPSSFLVLLKLLLSADQSTAKCNSLRDEIEQFNADATDHLEPYHLIGKIMHYHTQALEALEVQLNELQERTNEIVNSFEETSKNLKISSLSTKFTCNMANIIEDIYQK